MFTGRLVATPYEQKKHRPQWSTAEPISYTYEEIIYTVPRNFHTDFATIPRVFWWYLPPHDTRIAAAAVIHDYLCKQRPEIPRAHAAKVFRSAMLDSNMPRWLAYVCSFVVRWRWK